MRKSFFQNAASFETYSALYDLGATPEQVKEAIILLLDPYIHDKAMLRELATSTLASEAIVIGQLSSNWEWKAILDECIAIREAAICKDFERAFQVMARFTGAIHNAQRSFAVAAALEKPRTDFDLEEFAFDLFHVIGVLTESNLQVYVKELHCLNEVSSGREVNCDDVIADDFGKVCEQLEQSIEGDLLLRPRPWGIRLNQWRNIAQHHSYKVVASSIVASYGKSEPKKEISLVRHELLELAHELMKRLGALRSSRQVTLLNNIDAAESRIPDLGVLPYSQATELFASFATQGFRLADLQISQNGAFAVIEDGSPKQGLERPVHCSQFIAAIANKFPRCNVQISYIANGFHSWTFSATAEQLERVMALDDPLSELAHIVSFKREQFSEQ